MNRSTRVLSAALAAAVAFAIAWLCTGRIDLPLLLSEGVFFVALIRFHPNRQVAVVSLGIGTASALAGIWCSVSWPDYSPLTAAILLDPSISAIFRGPVATGYALLLCGAGSYLWATLARVPSSSPRWQKTSFSVESDAPDHVIRIDRRPEC